MPIIIKPWNFSDLLSSTLDAFRFIKLKLSPERLTKYHSNTLAIPYIES